MKLQIYILLSILLVQNIYSQNIEVYSGWIASYGLNSNKDFLSKPTSKFLPSRHYINIGYSVLLKDVTSKYNLALGMEFLQTGAKEIVPFDIPPGAIPPDEYIKFSNIRMPIIGSVKLIKNWTIETGISLNYSFRKNQSFLVIRNELISSTYKKYTFQYIIGTSLRFAKCMNLRFNYNHSLNPYSDTGKVYDTSIIGLKNYLREYKKMHFFNMTLGYYF